MTKVFPDGESAELPLHIYIYNQKPTLAGTAEGTYMVFMRSWICHRVSYGGWVV